MSQNQNKKCFGLSSRSSSRPLTLSFSSCSVSHTETLFPLCSWLWWEWMLIDHSLSWKPGTGAHKKGGLQMCVRYRRLIRCFIGVFYCPACMHRIVATIINIINLIHTTGGKMAAPHIVKENMKKMSASSATGELFAGSVCVSETCLFVWWGLVFPQMFGVDWCSQQGVTIHTAV